MCLIVQIILLLLSLPLIIFLVPPADKTQHFVHLNLIKLINGISRDLQKLLNYFNGIAIVAFLKIQFAAFGEG